MLRDNAVLAHLLGLCPLLAVTTTTLNGVLLGAATLFCLTTAGVVVSLLRHAIAHETRLLAFVVVVACLVSAVDLLLETFFYVPHLTLGLFVPLIVTNCAIFAHLETFAARRSAGASLVAGLSRGFGLASVLVVVGLMRELVATGEAASVFGGSATTHMQLALSPPGAFFALAALLAWSQWAGARREPGASPVDSPKSPEPVVRFK